MSVNGLLDDKIEKFFPKDGRWYSNCFRKSNIISEENLPCHLRDDKWLADLIIKKYNLYSLGKDTILEYIANSEKFNKLRHEYELEIVRCQIERMLNDGDYWIVGERLDRTSDVFSTKRDYSFRKGVVDTLLAIGMNIDAIEERIEKNANKWREYQMRSDFYNLYVLLPTCFFPYDNERKALEEPSQEHYEKWLKLRLYEYYIEHKSSVEKYGEILPEMKMTTEEVNELRKWLKEEDHKIKNQNQDYNECISDSTIKSNIRYNLPDFVVEDKYDLSDFVVENKEKPKSLIKRLFNRK